MEKMRMKSQNMVSHNIAVLGKVFPNCVTEGKDKSGKPILTVNMEVLQQMFTEETLAGDESYEFTWVGKKAAIVEANKPIKKTLRPDVEHSKEWDTTENLYIEGDNLEALKLLQESYLSAIKLIYIDPPYNTGHDFVYPDSFIMNHEEYANGTGYFDEDGNVNFSRENSETSGKYHSDWCSMIYSRLMLARNLLTDDGVILINMDENEIANLQKICSEVFGEANDMGTIVWDKRNPKGDARGISYQHEYILVYARSKAVFTEKCKMLIIVVPSIAIREGVYKTFQVTQEHFAEEYGKKIRFFIYNSAHLTEIDRFASDSSITVMIINSQAFSAKGKDARRIYMKLDELRSRRPIDIIARTNPIVIIDEPQSVEGKQTKENLKQFHPLMTLRYSATHKSDSIYNMVYRLDAVEAYKKRLVKKIAVKGITKTGTTATESYVYLESINLSKSAPTATLQFDFKGAAGIRKKSQKVGVGFNLYDHSGELPEYKDGFVVKSIDGRDDSVEFTNGIKIYAGDVIGKVSEEQLRRIQIRETIVSHIERERYLFYKGIKVLSLFFIDEVAHYKEYDKSGQHQNGLFAQMFEEEYQDIMDHVQREIGGDDYLRYLEAIPASSTHAGYFSIDKKGHIVNQVAGDDKKSNTSNDMDAYDLIMKNKELLLDRDPKRSPVRFIFSHSALREGWDNPNVFQICTLKQSSSEVRKRQEVGRGLRLCVNQDGERMDANVLGSDVHKVNVLTVIASESYDSYAKGLQTELADEIKEYASDVIGSIGSIYDSKVMMPENARSRNVELQAGKEKLSSREPRALYLIDFDTDELVRKAVASLNKSLRVPKIFFKVESGQMNDIKSREDFLSGVSMVRKSSENYGSQTKIAVNRGVKYDLIGKLVDETGLTRKAVIQILTGIEKRVFDQFKDNPEEFIIRAASLINDQKAAAMIGNMTCFE